MNENIQLKQKIESYYTNEVSFGGKGNDIRQNVFNYNNPIATANIKGVEFRIVVGLIDRELRLKTYLLYANGIILEQFYSINNAKQFAHNLATKKNKANESRKNQNGTEVPQRMRRNIYARIL